MKREFISHLSFNQSELNLVCCALATYQTKLLDELISNPHNPDIARLYSEVALKYNQLFEVLKTKYLNK